MGSPECDGDGKRTRSRQIAWTRDQALCNGARTLGPAGNSRPTNPDNDSGMMCPVNKTVSIRFTESSVELYGTTATYARRARQN